ncbi:hypothetical protein ACNFBT_11715 [Pseudomonas sp. NY15181]|uniref:hypothetical protein n=1 Tax=Pseudomonas sp. NY15181 TaxID=3400349 RepID=UPI003A8C8921
MISEKLLQEIQKTTRILDQYPGFTDSLHAISHIQQTSLESLKKILETNSTQDTINEKENAKAEIYNLTYNASRREKFKITHSALRDLSESLSDSEIEILRDAEQLVEKFTDSFDGYLHSTSFNTALILTQNAQKLQAKLKEIRSLEETLNNHLHSHSDKPTLKIYIPENLSLSLFGQKIQAFAGILDICCQILGTTIDDEEVIIEKVESGSLFAKISAHPLVVALATIVITQGSQYVFNRFDSSKDLDNLKDATEIIEKSLKIRDFLESNKIDTHELDEELKKSSVQLIKHLGRLVKDTTEIEVNDRKIQSNTQNLIPKSTTRSLEDKSNSSD